MQSGVGALIEINMDGDFFDQMKGLAVDRFDALEIGGNDVVRFASRNALGELAHVVGMEFPTDLVWLVFAAAGSDSDSVDGMVVGPPDGPYDQSVRLAFGLRSGLKAAMGSQSRREKHHHQKTKQRQLGKSLARTQLRSSHRLRSPPLLLPLLLRSLLRRLSTPGDWS